MKFQEFLDSKEYLYEMSTIGPKSHRFGIDIKLHILQPGKHKLSHGPRVKCIKQNINKDFSISLNEDVDKMFLVGDYQDIINTKEFNILFKMIKKYRIAFLNMWYNPYMTQDDLLEQFSDIDSGIKVEKQFK